MISIEAGDLEFPETVAWLHGKRNPINEKDALENLGNVLNILLLHLQSVFPTDTSLEGQRSRNAEDRKVCACNYLPRYLAGVYCKRVHRFPTGVDG